MRNFRLILTTVLIILSFLLYGQNEKLNPYSSEYFTELQVDTMIQKFIKAQNYIALHSWDIINKENKYSNNDLVYNRDSVDIRPYLLERKETSKKFIYNAYLGKVIVLNHVLDCIYLSLLVSQNN